MRTRDCHRVSERMVRNCRNWGRRRRILCFWEFSEKDRTARWVALFECVILCSWTTKPWRESEAIRLNVIASVQVYLARELKGGQTQAIKVCLHATIILSLWRLCCLLNQLFQVVQKDFVIRHQKLDATVREKHVLASLSYERGGHPFVTQLYCTFHDLQRLCKSFNTTLSRLSIVW